MKITTISDNQAVTGQGLSISQRQISDYAEEAIQEKLKKDSIE